jgi:hypothetical protein
VAAAIASLPESRRTIARRGDASIAPRTSTRRSWLAGWIVHPARRSGLDARKR